MLNRLLTFLCTLVLVIPITSFAKDKIIIQKGTSLAVCQDIRKLLQAPENSKITQLKPSNDKSPQRILFPASFKNFKQPIWEDVSENEIQKEAPAKLKQIKDISSSYILKKFTTKIPFNPIQFTFYLADFGVDGKKYLIPTSNNYLFMEEHNDNKIVQSFNKWYGASLPFLYKQELFFYYSIAPDVLVYQPRYIDPPGELWMKNVCSFNNKHISEGK